MNEWRGRKTPPEMATIILVNYWSKRRGGTAILAPIFQVLSVFFQVTQRIFAIHILYIYNTYSWTPGYQLLL